MNLPLGKAAAAIGVHPDTMRTYCERGYVDAWRLPSGRWRINADSLDDMRRAGDDQARAKSKASAIMAKVGAKQGKNRRLRVAA